MKQKFELKYLEKNAVCKKCGIEMKNMNIPYKELPAKVRRVLDELCFRHELYKCPKCGSSGIHTY